jgi:hypothetical protein
MCENIRDIVCGCVDVGKRERKRAGEVLNTLGPRSDS